MFVIYFALPSLSLTQDPHLQVREFLNFFFFNNSHGEVSS